MQRPMSMIIFAVSLIFLTMLSFGSAGAALNQPDEHQALIEAAAGGGYPLSAATSTAYTFDITWGITQFDFPDGVAVDGSGNVYVADTSNNRIQKFNSSGVFVAM